MKERTRELAEVRKQIELEQRRKHKEAQEVEKQRREKEDATSKLRMVLTAAVTKQRAQQVSCGGHGN